MHNPSKIKMSDVQVVFIDLQKQIVARSKTTPPESLSKSAGVLAELAHLFDFPITLSVVPEDNKTPELIPELQEQTEGLEQFLRAGAHPFMDKTTSKAMKSHQRKTLLVAGFATEVSVLHTVTAGMEKGYRVITIVDACGGLSERTESAALRQIADFGGEVSSTVAVATALIPDFSTELGQKMFPIIQKLRLA